MATNAADPIVAAKGGSFLIEDRAPDEVFTPEDLSEEQVMIGQTADDFMVKELVPRLPELLKLDYELSRELLRKAGRAGPPRGRGPGGVRRPGPRQGLRLPGRGEGRARRQLRHHLRGPGRDRHPPDRLLRHRGAEEEVPAEARLGRVGQLLLALRGLLGQRRHERQGPGRALRGREELDPERREDVAQQRRLRRPLHHLRQGGRRALHGVHRREGDARGEPGRGGEEDRHQGQQHAAAHPHRRRDPEGEPARARSGRATRSPSTSSTSGASSSAPWSPGARS